MSRLWSVARVVVAGLALCSIVAVAHAADSRVRGQVLDAADQRPIAGAEIELQNAGGGPGYFRARTDAQGVFVIERVPSARWYLVTVSADGYTDWALESWQFPDAQREVALTVPLDRAGRLDVLARGSDSKPLGAARVTVRRDRGSNWWEAYRRDPEPRWTGKDGHTVFEGLSSGAWTVAVEAQGKRGEESRAVPVRRGETTPVSLTLTRPASVAGTVRLADSTTVAGASLIVRGPGEGSAVTDADGNFVIEDLPPGRYRVELTQEGFEPGSARDGIVLSEGESKGGVRMTAKPRPAALAFVLERDVFVPQPSDDGTTQARVALGVRAFRVGALDLTLYRVPISRLLDPVRGGRLPGPEASDTTGFERVTAWRHDLPEGAPFAWRETQLMLPMELAPGAYVVAARSGTVTRRQLFFVSDLSLLVKRSGSRLAAWVGSLRTGVSLSNVQCFVRDGRLTSGDTHDEALRALTAKGGAAVTTGPDGLAWLDASGTSDVTVIVTSDRGGVAVVRSPLAPRSAVSGDQALLFTERPVYRPGQVVHWKLFARRGTPQGYAMPEAARVTLHLDGPEQSIEVPDASLSPTGAANGDVTLPAEAPLGDYTLRAEVGDASTTATFGVLQYRKPEFKVEVTPDREVSLNGDDVRFQIAANYFFGAPVVGATVRYTLFESRIGGEPRWDAWDPWGDGDGDRGEGTGYGRLLQSGETRTDLDGRVALNFTPARASHDRRLSLEVEVLDGAQRVVSGRGSALMGRGQFTLRIAPRSRLVMAGEPIVVDVYSEDLLGKPVQAAVTVELDQEVWNPIERRSTRASRPWSTMQGTTSALRGSVRVTLAPATARAGQLVVRARAEDARGNKLTSETRLWVYDPKVWDYAYRYPVLEAVPDGTGWAPGDTARILVNTDVKDASVLVSIEGRELRELRVQPLFGRTGLVRVPIREGDGPNLFVKLHVRRGREIQTRTLELPVRAARHDLTLRVTADKPTYRPREKAVFEVETRDTAGQPVAAEVALGVVDEAIYALRPDRTPKAHDVFYGRIANAVTTVAAFPVLYYGGADKGEARDVRRDFRDVAAWAPDVHTGADGRGRIELTWPDNLTTWRATARGVTPRTLVGETTSKTMVTKDVVARLAVPRTFTAGDEAELVSVVSNRTGTPLANVKESLVAAGAARATGAASSSSGIAAGGESRGRWGVVLTPDAPTDGSAMSARFTFRAEAKVDADALEQDVPVRPRTVALRLSASGSQSSGTATIAVVLPDHLVRTGAKVEISAQRSVRALLVQAAEWLGDYPYGCSEQTANALSGGLARLRAQGGPAAAKPAEVQRLARHVERLAALQGMMGVWGWWPNGEPDAEMSALAAGALARAAAAGVQRDAALAALDRANDGLLQQSSALRSVDAEAYWAMHLAPIVDVPGSETRFQNLRLALDAVVTSVLAQRPQLSVGGKACAAVACARLGRTADAQAMLALVLSASTLDGSGRSVAGTDAADWFGDTVERTAWALEAVVRVTPADPRGSELLRWLAARRDGREWRSTRVTGAVVEALDAWLTGHPEPASVTPARLRWNGTALTAAGDGRVQVPVALLKGGHNTLEIETPDAPPTWWAWSAIAPVPSPGPAPDRSRLSLTREYLRAVRTADRRGRPRWLTTALEPQQPLRVGEGVIVRLTLEAARELRWLAVTDPVPGGFEIDAVLAEGVERPWSVFGEARDGEAAFFMDRVPEGRTVIEYLVRPEIAGRFTALPTSAFGMYDAALATRGGETRLRVVNP